MKKRFSLIALSAFILLFLASVLIVENPKTNKEIRTPIANAQNKTETIELSGSGQEATKDFNLEGGLSVFTMTHTGGSNFIVELLDENGNTIDLLVNEIGTFDGKKAVGIKKSGKYLLDISAGGSWTVKIDQPRPSEAPPVPQEFKGNGQQVSEVFSIGKGLARFEMTHSGSSNFIVTLLDDNGNTVDLLVNEIGTFDGSKAVSIRNTGMYLLDIQADGAWTIKVTGETPKKEEVKRTEDKKSGNNGEGCFIATAVYGDPNAPEIDVLRDFRDETLLTNPTGQKLVEFYYQYSPPIADFISNRPIAKVLIKEALIKPAVTILENDK